MADDPVFVEVRYIFERRCDGAAQRLGLALNRLGTAFRVKLQAGVKQSNDQPGELRVVRQRFFHIGLRERNARLK